MIKIATIALALGLVAGASYAQTYKMPTPGPVTVAVLSNYNGTIIDDFSSSIASGYTLTINGSNPVVYNDPSSSYSSGIYSDSISGVAAQPNSADGAYLAVLPGADATFSAPGGIYSMSIELGSLDTYNSFTFSGTNVGGTAFTETVTGSELEALGGFTNTSGSQIVDFSFNGAKVNSVVFSSSSNSLEFDNIAVETAPEPAAWMLMTAGVGLAGFAMRRNRRRVSKAAFA